MALKSRTKRAPSVGWARRLADIVGEWWSIGAAPPGGSKMSMGAFYSPEMTLWNAAHLGDAALVETLATVRRAKFSTGIAGRTALMAAVAGNHAECARILAPFSDLAQRDGKKKTALMIAAENGHAEALDAILGQSDALACDSAGKSALSLAIEKGSRECVERLLPLSELGNADARGATALMIAAAGSKGDSWGCFETVMKQEKAAKTLFDRDEMQGTALHAAAKGGEPKIVRALMQEAERHGRRAEYAGFVDRNGQTALMAGLSSWSSDQWRESEGALLDSLRELAREESVKHKDPVGRTALMKATRGPLAAVQLLAPASDIEARDNAGKTAIDWAAADNGKRNAGVADWLAASAPPALARTALEKWGVERMPKTAALFEALALREEAGLALNPEAASLAQAARAESAQAPRRKARSL